jgi:hypothetical protein
MDWRMVGVFLSLFQFIFMAVIFSVLKFNDLKHLDIDLKELKKEFHEYELKNDERHMDNLKSVGTLAENVSNLAGKFEAFHKK